MRSPLMYPVPTNMRHHQITTEPPHTSPQHTQPPCRSEFLRLIKQDLHSDTNTQQRRSRARSFFDQSIEAVFFERLHASCKRTDTRQHQPLGRAQHALIAADDRFATRSHKCLLDRAEVADAVIDDRYIHNDPFVLGTPTMRLFRSTACRNARAEALNVP